jgi:sulfonate transport system ATP-binding protein
MFMTARIAGENPAPVQETPQANDAANASAQRADARKTGSAGVSVTIDRLDKHYGAEHVLTGLELTIPAGQFVAVIGRSGCGKSTLLRLIVGLEQPTSGGIAIGDGSRDDARRTRIVFQEPRLLPWANVAANVDVGLGDGKKDKGREAQVDAALAQVGLRDRAGDWPSVLSGGQRQRVALARALVSRPGLLALDEPLGALDALTRIAMQSLVERLWLAQRMTAVLVTHDVAEAIALADRVIVLDAGKVALDVAVDLPRPRDRSNPAFAALEGRLLDAIFGVADVVY